MEINYEKDLYIDPTALDVEWLDQPSRFMKYAGLAAQARAKTEESKRALDVVTAQLDAEIRAKAGDKKPTESAIHNQIILSPQYDAALRRNLDDKYEADQMMNAVRAMDQRKDALENMVRLQAQQYFSAPKEPRDLAVEWDRRVRRDGSARRVAGALNGTGRPPEDQQEPTTSRR